MHNINIGKHMKERVYRTRYSIRGCVRVGIILFEYGEVTLLYIMSPVLEVREDVKFQ